MQNGQKKRERMKQGQRYECHLPMKGRNTKKKTTKEAFKV